MDISAIAVLAELNLAGKEGEMSDTKYYIRVFDRGNWKYLSADIKNLAEIDARRTYQEYCMQFRIQDGYTVRVFRHGGFGYSDVSGWSAGSPMAPKKQLGPSLPGDNFGYDPV